MSLKDELLLRGSERALMAALEPGNTDVTIEALYAALGGTAFGNRRTMQHHVGATASRVNKKLRDGACIKPGIARYTYRLYLG